MQVLQLLAVQASHDEPELYFPGVQAQAYASSSKCYPFPVSQLKSQVPVVALRVNPLWHKEQVELEFIEH